MNTLKIAITGARGVGNYGGFETVVGELAPRLVEMGFDLYCSCEKTQNGKSKLYKGVNLIYFPLAPPKNYTARKVFEILYDIYFVTKCSFFCDLIYHLGIGAGPFLMIPRILGKISFVNVDGIEWERTKFTKIEKLILRLLFYSSCITTNYIIIDNTCLRKYIPLEFNSKFFYIPYGASIPNLVLWNPEKLEKFFSQNLEAFANLSPNMYWLVVARLEPENSIHTIIDAFLNATSHKLLLLVGKFTSEAYKKRIYKMVNNSDSFNRIIFLGSIYDLDILNMLRQNCFGYIHGHTVGGTNPSLLEAMIMRNIIIAQSNSFNREVCGKSSLYFSNSVDLKVKIEDVERNYEHYLPLKDESYYRVRTFYEWNLVAEKYVSIFKLILRHKGD